MQCKKVYYNKYKNLNNKEEAFIYAKKLFDEDNTYENYKNARNLLNNVAEIKDFKAETINKLKKKDSYISMEILSYEGDVGELFNIVSNYKIDEGYYEFKYLVKSLIYRCFYESKITGNNICELLEVIEKENDNGIIDMIPLLMDKENKEVYLVKVIEILRKMVEFHFQVGTRSSYAKGAYYCSVAKDIYEFLNRKAEFESYYRNIMLQNKRRPALRDEMERRMNN
ncbi:hypothetical protein [Clostridium gasigenes]|uniref:Uncharacterized protein n=1 Tax=Clostridium gasigenes TaxID=94869 RepID=A0A7X0VSR1_9CLOT|nr:hypothetical protein [Clostridium gasigenes]MBB6714871.1 hypothetical protein [Clostridium gasigenes]